MVEKTDPTTVFISHAEPDSDFAQSLAKGLKQVGINARLDQNENPDRRRACAA